MGREKKREGEAPQIFWRRTGAVKMIAVSSGFTHMVSASSSLMSSFPVDDEYWTSATGNVPTSTCQPVAEHG